MARIVHPLSSKCLNPVDDIRAKGQMRDVSLSLWSLNRELVLSKSHTPSLNRGGAVPFKGLLLLWRSSWAPSVT